MVTLAAPGARPQFQAFNTARWDSFSQWANERSNGFATSASAAHLPYEVRVYGSTLDQDGRWEYLNPYGYVWFPAVGVAWRPYYNGWWAHTRYGWTWRGHDRWAWPTHHYGRWGFNGAAWYWIPSAGWGPAWVSWGVSAGYVSWAPLGWNGSPAIGFWARRDHPAYAPRYDPWRGWTVVPRDQFGPRRPVRPRAIDGNRLDDGVRSAMILQNHGPAYAGSAVPRQSFTVPPAQATRVATIRASIDQGAVRRPQDAATTPAATPPPGGVPQRRITDAPRTHRSRPRREIRRRADLLRPARRVGRTQPGQRRHRPRRPRARDRSDARRSVTASGRSCTSADSHRETTTRTARGRVAASSIAARAAGRRRRRTRRAAPTTAAARPHAAATCAAAVHRAVVRRAVAGGSQAGSSQGGRSGGSDAARGRAAASRAAAHRAAATPAARPALARQRRRRRAAAAMTRGFGVPAFRGSEVRRSVLRSSFFVLRSR